MINRLQNEKPTKQVKQALIDAVNQRAKQKVGLLFSGGVDSTVLALILKQLNIDFKCFAIGIRGSKDVQKAEKIAQKHNLDLKIKYYTLKQIQKTVKKIVKIFETSNYIRISVGTVVYEAAKFAKQEGYSNILTGLGSEEIFGGYRRHKESDNINKECWRGLTDVIWRRDLQRDVKIAQELSIEFKTPFLDKELIKSAMSIPGKEKVKNKISKIPLRQIALELGLEKKYAMRKKIAAQYGSGFDKAIEKIAKIKGFKYKSDYIAEVLSKI